MHNLSLGTVAGTNGRYDSVSGIISPVSSSGSDVILPLPPIPVQPLVRDTSRHGLAATLNSAAVPLDDVIGPGRYDTPTAEATSAVFRPEYLLQAEVGGTFGIKIPFYSFTFIFHFYG